MKEKPSKLDAYTDRLDEWFGIEKRPLKEVQEQLRLDGCSVSCSRLGEWWSRRQGRRLEEQLFTTIASGGRMSRELDAAFAKNPAPEIEQLIAVTKTLVMSLQVQGSANPELLKLADSMHQTVLSYLTAKTKAEIEGKKLDLAERRVRLLEEKAKQADQAKEVTESGLTPEEKLLKMKQIFGMS